MEQFFNIIFVVYIGLVLGSLATALCYRLPRDISMMTRARSQCTSCGHNLSALDLVPLLSWAFLRGRCRYCKARIGLQYPLIELATLALCLLFYSVYGLTPETAAVYALAPVLVSIIDIDLRYKIIPDSLNLAIFLTGVAGLGINAALAEHPLDFILQRGLPALGGTSIFGLASWGLRAAGSRIMKREAMGLGDVKFFAAAGFWLGMNANAAAALMMISGVLGVIIALVWKKLKGEAEVPFGPSLIIAFIATLHFFWPGFMIR